MGYKKNNKSEFSASYRNCEGFGFCACCNATVCTKDQNNKSEFSADYRNCEGFGFCACCNATVCTDNKLNK